jgi:hypothetical protein
MKICLGVTLLTQKTKVKRKKVKVYKKYELITSHSCEEVLCQTTSVNCLIQNFVFGGWSTEEMMLHYDNSTSKEAANELKKYWETQKKKLIDNYQIKIMPNTDKIHQCHIVTKKRR